MSKYSPNQAKHLRELGVYLRQQRLERSLSLEQIAATTFIRLAMLQAIEEGQHDCLPELVYVQGFIRRYADVLKLDSNALAKQISSTEESVAVDIPSQLVSAASASQPDSATAEPPRITRTAQKSPTKATHPVAKKKKTAANGQLKPLFQEGFKGLKLYWLYLLLLGGAIAGLFYLIYRSESPEPSKNPSSPPYPSSSQLREPVSLPSPVTKASAVQKTTPPTTVISPSPAPPVAQTSPSSAQPVIPKTTPSVSASPLPVTSPASPTGQNSPVTVSVQLQEASWLKVEVDGKTAYEGILEKDTQQTWSGQKQVTLRSGNAGAVNLAVNQQAAQPLGELGEVKEVIITPESSN